MKKNLLLLFLLTGCLLSFAVCAETGTSGDNGPGSLPIRVALFIDEGVTASASANFSLCLADTEKYAITHINGAGIRSGLLNNFDVAIFPGGSGSGQAESLMEEGRDSVRAFISRGGGYLGVCAGAYLVTTHYTWSLGLLNAKVLDTQHWNRGNAMVELGFSEAGKKFFGLTGETIDIEYRQGPLLAPGVANGMPGYVELAKFNTEVALNGAPAYVMTGSTAAAMTTYGRGKVFAMSPHPEMTDPLGWMIASIVDWLVEDDDFVAITSPMPDAIWETGSKHKIEWLSYRDKNNMKIEYSPDNGDNWITISAAFLSGYEWTLPDTPSENAVLRITSNDRPDIADNISLRVVPAIKVIRSAATGDWSRPETWIGGEVPSLTDDVLIDTDHIITVDVESSCRNINFGNKDSKLRLNANLSIYGNFIRFNPEANPFYTTLSLWLDGAKIIFRGDQLIQLIDSLATTSINPYPFSFNHVVIDKGRGKVATAGPTNAKISLGNRVEIINGMFELTETHDIEGRRVKGDTAHTAFYIYADGYFRMQGGTSHIRAGNFIGADNGKLGRMVVHGKVTLSPGSTNRTSFEGIDIEDGGYVEIIPGFGVAASSFNPGVINIKKGGIFRSGITTGYWYNNTLTPNAIHIHDGGELWITHASEPVLPNGGIIQESGSKIRFSYGDAILPSSVSSYYNLVYSGTGTRTSSNNVNILESLELSGEVILPATGPIYLYAPTATLKYGDGFYSLPQTTTNVEWPVTNGPANIEINNSAGVKLHAPRAIGGNLNLIMGRLSIGDYNLKIGTSSLASHSSFVVTDGTGKLAAKVEGNVLFPVGTASSYTPLMFLGNNVGHDIQVKVSSAISNPLQINARAVQLEWILSESDPGNNNGSLRLQWNSENAGLDFNISEPVSIGIWNGSSYDVSDVIVTGNGPFSVDYSLSGSLPGGPIVVANKAAFVTTDVFTPATGSWKIYPNPAGNYLNISIIDRGFVQVDVFSIDGIKIRSAQVSESGNTIDISELKSGIYIIRLALKNGPVIGRFIKN